jgi:hypothetical protein
MVITLLVLNRETIIKSSNALHTIPVGTAPVVVASVDTVLVDKTIFLILLFPLSATSAKVISDEITTPWG